jgi:tagatose-6-phosphate ketose/aldose isomerase
VSCARSGGSPESIAAIKIAGKLVQNLYQIVITCNPESVLAKAANDDKNSLLLLMPKDSNDKGFAMTGSFTSMTLASILLFNLDKLSKLRHDVNLIAEIGEKFLETSLSSIGPIAGFPAERAVYLGSSTHSGLAKESALKLLELTSGKITTSSDSFLGFRHGPKSVINDHTLVFCFLSQDPYARQYEYDLIEEMAEENGKKKIVAISANRDQRIEGLAHLYITEDSISFEDDVFWILPYILYAQVYALVKSIQLGVDPDNPSPDGSVNRVVQGVKIYPYKD